MPLRTGNLLPTVHAFAPVYARFGGLHSRGFGSEVRRSARFHNDLSAPDIVAIIIIDNAISVLYRRFARDCLAPSIGHD